MEAGKTSEETKKKISEALRKAWKQRRQKSKSLPGRSGENGNILSAIDQTTQALRKLTLQEISALSKNKAVGSKVDELVALATHLKKVVQSNAPARKPSQ